MDLIGLIAIPNWLIVICMIFAIIYVYMSWNFGYWESQNVKTIKPFPILGSLASNFFETVSEIQLKNISKYGKIYGMYETRNPYLMVHDLEMIKTLLIKDFNNFPNRRAFPLGGKARITRQFLTMLRGDEWKSARQVLTPTFTAGKLKQMAGLMDESAHKLIKSLDEDIKKYNGEINVKNRFGVFAMDVIASCCFGTNVNSQDPNDPFLQHGRLLFKMNFTFIAIFVGITTNVNVVDEFSTVLFPKLIELFELSILPVKFLAYFEQVVHKVVDYRRSNSTRRNDFLQLLLDAQERESEGKLLDDPDSGPSSNSSSVDTKKNKVLDESGLVANSILFFVAGFETTSNTISFTTYLLALNPECQQKLMEEIDLAIEKHGKLSHEVIMSMSYLDKVISESLRMYPAALRLERVCVNDCKLGDIFIRKGVMVAAGVYGVHFDPEIYPEPNKFDPERFSPEMKAQRHPMAYLPFGAGPRVCIGIRFAMMEIKICLANFFSKFKVFPSSKTEIPIKIRKGISLLLPINDITLKVEPRH